MYKVLRISKTEADVSLLSQCVKQAIGRSVSLIRDNRQRKSMNEGYAVTLLDAAGNMEHEDDLMTFYPAENHISFGYLFVLPDAVCLEFVSHLKTPYMVIDTVKSGIKIIIVTQTLNQWEQTVTQSYESELYEDAFKQVYTDLKSEGLTRHWKVSNVS